MNNNPDVLSAFTDMINPGWIWLATKIMFLVGIVIYSVFALSVFRQSQLMDNVLKIPIRPSFKSIALFYLLASIGYFLLALLLL